MIRLIVLFLILLSNVAWSQDTNIVVILHTNDTHGSINNYSKVKFISDSIRSCYKDVFFVSAGDIFSGNPYVDKYYAKGFPIVYLMNNVGYNVSELGNHEFDYGQQILDKRIKQAKFDFLCSNINTKNTVITQPKPYKIFTTNSGLNIFILGVLQIGKNGLPDTHPEKIKNIEFTKPEKEIKKYKQYANTNNCFILLSHLGVKWDERVAKHFTFINTIIGGHSHTKIKNGEWIKKTFITQTGSRLQNLGVLKLVFVDKKLISQTDSLINLNNYKNYDKSLATKIKSFEKNKEFFKVVGKTDITLTAPNELGYLMSLSQKQITNADFAFQNTGGIRLDSIKAGDITKLDIYNLDPFNNEIYIYNLSLKQIKSFIRYAYGIRNKNNLIPAGLKINYIIKNNKLKEINITDTFGNPLSKSKKYKVAINSYMAGSYKFKGKKNFVKSGKTTNQAIFIFLKNTKTITKETLNFKS